MIDVKSLVKTFGNNIALDGISFSIGGGSVFGLVGSNGAGKSTLLRSLAGIYSPDGGSIEIDGQQPFENSAVKGKLFFISDYPYFFHRQALKKWQIFIPECIPIGALSDIKSFALCSRWIEKPKSSI